MMNNYKSTTMISIKNIEPVKLEIRMSSYLDFECKVDKNLSNNEKSVFIIESKSLDRDDELELSNEDIKERFNNLKMSYSNSKYSDDELYHYSICELLHEEIIMYYDKDYGEECYYKSNKLFEIK